MPYMKKKDELHIASIPDSFVEEARQNGWELFDVEAYIAGKQRPIPEAKADTIEPQVKRSGRPRRVEPN